MNKLKRDNSQVENLALVQFALSYSHRGFSPVYGCSEIKTETV